MCYIILFTYLERYWHQGSSAAFDVEAAVTSDVRWSRSCSGASFTGAIEAIISRPLEKLQSYGVLMVF